MTNPGVQVDDPERKWAMLPVTGTSLDGCESQHLGANALREKLGIALNKVERNHSSLDAIVLRSPSGMRVQPHRVQVSPEKGLVGDRWSNGKAKLGDQVSMMNLDVAYAMANAQSLVLFGDNLFTRLDLSEEALPVGAHLQIGPVALQVSTTPHVPCGQFRGRFGVAAFRQAAKNPRLRGIYLTVIKGGEIQIGDEIIVQHPTS